MEKQVQVWAQQLKLVAIVVEHELQNQTKYEKMLTDSFVSQRHFGENRELLSNFFSTRYE